MLLLSLTYSKVLGVGVALSSHLLSLASRTVTVGSKNLKAFLYGWLPLSNAYGIPSLATQHKSNTNSISFHCSTTQNLSPFRGSVNGCVLSRGSVLRTSPPACILSCLWHYFIWNANGIAVKKPDKNLSGRSDEREVKICKNRFFTLHSSFFILRKLRFLTPIPYL